MFIRLPQGKSSVSSDPVTENELLRNGKKSQEMPVERGLIIPHKKERRFPAVPIVIHNWSERDTMRRY